MRKTRNIQIYQIDKTVKHKNETKFSQIHKMHTAWHKSYNTLISETTHSQQSRNIPNLGQINQILRELLVQ